MSFRRVALDPDLSENVLTQVFDALGGDTVLNSTLFEISRLSDNHLIYAPKLSTAPAQAKFNRLRLKAKQLYGQPKRSKKKLFDNLALPFIIMTEVYSTSDTTIGARVAFTYSTYDAPDQWRLQRVEIMVD